MLLFSKLNYIFFGYFDPGKIFLIMKINIVRGDLTEISAKTEALHVTMKYSLRLSIPDLDNM